MSAPVLRIDLPVTPALLPHCRRLVADGVDPATVLHVYRGDTLCFVPAPLAAFAALATEERADRSIRLVRYRETAAPGDGYARLTAVAERVHHADARTLGTAQAPVFAAELDGGAE